MKKFWIVQMLSIALLSATFSPAAFALDKCKVLKKTKAQIDRKKEDLEMLEKVHRQHTEANEIAERLINSEDEVEIMKLAEALDDNAKEITEEQGKRYKYVAGSTGAIIISTFLIKNLSKTTRGQGIWRRMKSQLAPGANNRRLLKMTLNTAFVISVLGTWWLYKQIKENGEKKNLLVDLVIKLNQIRDLTAQVLELREEIEEREVSFNLKLEELIFEDLVEVETTNDDIELKCLEVKEKEEK